MPDKNRGNPADYFCCSCWYGICRIVIILFYFFLARQLRETFEFFLVTNTPEHSIFISKNCEVETIFLFCHFRFILNDTGYPGNITFGGMDDGKFQL